MVYLYSSTAAATAVTLRKDEQPNEKSSEYAVSTAQARQALQNSVGPSETSAAKEKPKAILFDTITYDKKGKVISTGTAGDYYITGQTIPGMTLADKKNVDDLMQAYIEDRERDVQNYAQKVTQAAARLRLPLPAFVMATYLNEKTLTNGVNPRYKRIDEFMRKATGSSSYTFDDKKLVCESAVTWCATLCNLIQGKPLLRMNASSNYLDTSYMKELGQKVEKNAPIKPGDIFSTATHMGTVLDTAGGMARIISFNNLAVDGNNNPLLDSQGHEAFRGVRISEKRIKDAQNVYRLA